MVKRLRRWVSRDKEHNRDHHTSSEMFGQKKADRGFSQVGRSFYFFDFDENVAFLSTPTYLFHKKSGEEIMVNSREFVLSVDKIGKEGNFADYRVDHCSRQGSFRCFRDQELGIVERLLKREQVFVKDIRHALSKERWKGPSWQCFYHATSNRRPLALITARGHHPETLKKGLNLFVQGKHIPQEPNYLGLFPVNNPEIRAQLGDSAGILTVPELKKRALFRAVEMALDSYGYSPQHRFGMSDDDPKNLSVIYEAMTELKSKYPEMSFFVIEARDQEVLKNEVYSNRVEVEQFKDLKQMDALIGQR